MLLAVTPAGLSQLPVLPDQIRPSAFISPERLDLFRSLISANDTLELQKQ